MFIPAVTLLSQHRTAIPGAQLSMVPLDLSDLVSVSDCAKRVLDSGVEYDVWINNAGAANIHCELQLPDILGEQPTETHNLGC